MIKNIELEVKINKHNVTEDVSKYLMSLTYTDYEKGATGRRFTLVAKRSNR